MPYTGNVQNAGETDANFDDASVNAPGVATTIDLTDYTVKTISAELTINGDQTLAPNEMLVSTVQEMFEVPAGGSLTIGDDVNDTSTAIIQTGTRTGFGQATIGVSGDLTTRGRTLLLSNNLLFNPVSTIDMDGTTLEFAEGSDNKRVRMSSTNATLNNITQTGNGRIDFFTPPVAFNGFNPVNQTTGAAQWISTVAGGTNDTFTVRDANGANLTYYGDAFGGARVEFLNPVVPNDQLIISHNTPNAGLPPVTTAWREAQVNLTSLTTTTIPTADTANIRLYTRDFPQGTIANGSWNSGDTYDGARRDYWLTPNANAEVLFNGNASDTAGLIQGNNGGKILLKALSEGRSPGGTYNGTTQLVDQRGINNNANYDFDFHIWGLEYQYNTFRSSLYGQAGVRMDNAVLLDDNFFVPTTFATNDQLAARLLTGDTGPVPGSKWSVDNLGELYSAFKQRKTLMTIGAVHGTALAGNLNVVTEILLPTIDTLYANPTAGNGGLVGLDFGALDVTIQANEANGLTPLTYTPFAPSDTEVTFIAGNALDINTATLAADEQFPGGIITTGTLAPRTGNTVTLNTNIENATIDMVVAGGGSFLLGDISISNATINDITSANVAQLDGVTFNDATVDTTGGIDISTFNITGNITFIGSGAITHTSGQTSQLTFGGATTSNEIDAIVTFQNEPHAQGGFFTILRNTGTDAAPVWAIVSTQAPGSLDVDMFTANDIGDYIAIWRPRSSRMATTFFRTTVTSGQVQTFEVTRTLISSTLLFDESTPTHPVNIVWSQGQIDADGSGTGTATQLELIGTVENTDQMNPPDAAQTQRELLTAYTDSNYVSVIAMRITGITDNANLILRDIIFPASPSETRIDGEFVQLTSDGTRQEFLTQVIGEDINGNDITNTLADMIVADISGGSISVPAVTLLANPAGITISDVVSAVNTAFTPLQRGVSYTVGALDANPIIQAPRNARYEQADGDVPTGTYPEL